MKHLKRFPKPQILVEKEKEWLEKFLESNKKRPDTSKYGHKKVRDCLNDISFYKCFYCESKLKGKVSEIDHYKEVSEYKEGAYEWENLFLSCENCNGKIPHQIIPVTEALNPFLDTDQEIKKHLTFEDEQITMKPDSILGSKTIQKFRLDSPSLDMLRLKQIKIFQQCCISVQKNMILEGRNKMSEKELESLRSFYCTR